MTFGKTGMFMRYLFLLFLFALPAIGAENPKREELLKIISEELQRRRMVREKEESAYRIIRGHESGKKVATESELAAARAIVRAAEERKPKVADMKSPSESVTGDSHGEEEFVGARLVDADVETVLRAYSVWRKEKVDASPEIMRLAVSLRFDKVKKSEAILRVEQAIREQAGIEIVRRDDGRLMARKTGNPEKQKPPNKAPEPTPGPVTPRASSGDSK